MFLIVLAIMFDVSSARFNGLDIFQRRDSSRLAFGLTIIRDGVHPVPYPAEAE